MIQVRLKPNDAIHEEQLQKSGRKNADKHERDQWSYTGICK